MSGHERYMQRCLELASCGAGNVAPNPMVGAVLVYNDIIIGEGYHRKYGEAHAEVNCINSVSEHNQSLIAKSTLYVSLEPCAHYGKTPPCADLVIEKKIPLVVIGCMDSYEEVNGRGMAKLRAAGVEVITGVMEKEARQLNRRFFTFHQQARPYIILKWAQSMDNKIAGADRSRVHISGELTNRMVHRWRAEEAAIMVGTNTALHDNPSLTTRFWKGNNPVRVIIDRQLKIPASHHLLSDGCETIVFNFKKETIESDITYLVIDPGKPELVQIMRQLHQKKLQSIMIEGGTKLIQSFIDEKLWDEARVIINEDMIIGQGITAPLLSDHVAVGTCNYLPDRIHYYKPAYI